MVTLTEDRYWDGVCGGWLGKLIGAAVGAPLDGQKQRHALDSSYPTTATRAHPRSAPGLGFAVVWLRTLESIGPRIAADDLIGAWLKHLTYAEHECAYARHNLRRDLRPPISGAFDNPFRESLGALARAELWGLVAPGDPRQAASYAYQDAVLDHTGPGVEAACLVAAMLSAAFVETEPARLVEAGLAMISQDSRVARAVRDVARWHGELADWPQTREMLLRSHGTGDVRDSAVAAGLIVLALLHEGGSFGRAVITAANCGWSTECTCGAAGAVAGVACGASSIPAEWRSLIHEELRAGPGVVGLGGPVPVQKLADRTVEMGRLVIRSECPGRVQLSEEAPAEPSSLGPGEGAELIRRMAMGPYVTSFRRGPLQLQVDYDTQPTIGHRRSKRLVIGVTNTGPRALEFGTHISAPAGFVATTNSDRVSLPEGGSVSFSALVSAPEGEAQIGASNQCTLFVSLEDETDLVVPITLVGEALWYAAGPYGSFDESHAPEQTGFISGETSLGGEGWRLLSVAEPAVNLLAGMEGEQGTYYLATDLLVARAHRGRLRVACNDGTKVWHNGEEVFWQHEHRPVSAASADEFEVQVEEGWNRLVIKMAQCSPRRFLSVVLKDPDRHLLAEAANTRPRPAS